MYQDRSQIEAVASKISNFLTEVGILLVEFCFKVLVSLVDVERRNAVATEATRGIVEGNRALGARSTLRHQEILVVVDLGEGGDSSDADG